MPGNVEIKEELLHFIWRYRLFRMPLVDMDDMQVELVDPGQPNRDSGPDFFIARIRSEGILWAGNVEIHKKASEWYQHGHHLDPAFDNVILHVVIDPDCQVKNSHGREIRTVKMEIAPEIRIRYELLMGNPEFIPCWRDQYRVDQGRMRIWLERLLVERLEERVAWILEEYDRCSGDWQEVLFYALARAFGQKINADPFEMLARSLTRKSIMDNCPDLATKEAILFGQAGMLRKTVPVSIGDGEPADSYYMDLSKEYSVLQANLGLQPIDGFLWKFLRLRPDNFPTIRISQFACSLENYPDLFSQLVDHADPVDFIMKMELRTSEYWTNHYRFGRNSPPREKRIGKNRMTGLFINAFLPVLFAFQRLDGKSVPGLEIPDIMCRIPAEDNRIIRMWRSLGREVPDIFYSQALLQLTNKYCKFKRCLSCYVGSQIIQTSRTEK